jgi:diguanylate cyclase (GGDEF)-like protein/PAS domain S-box-containing protein
VLDRGYANLNHSGPDRHDPTTNTSSSAHATEHGQGAVAHPSDDWLHTVLENTSDVICVLKADGSFRYISPAVKRVLGYLPEALVGMVGIDYVHTEDAAFVAESFAQILKTPGVHAPLQLRVRTADGSLRYVEAIPNNQLDDPTLKGVVVTFRDLTERVRMEEVLREAQERYRTLVEQLPAVVYVDTLKGPGFAAYTGPQAEAMLGYPLDAWDADPLFWTKLLHPDDKEHVVAENTRANVAGESLVLEYRMISRDGRVVWIRDESVLLRDEAGQPLHRQGVLFDITERKALEEQLQHQAFHDTLTGLANRALFSERLQHAVARTQRHGGKVAVLFMDLDNFKFVNDSLGHKAGDELLVDVAGRLRASLRPEDTAARLGGDEFAVLLEDLVDVGEATRVVERIADKLRSPFDLGERETFVTASIGVAIGGANGAKKWPEELMRDADMAMYRAKRSGKARYALFEEAMSARALERLELTNDLRQALAREEFAIQYQPKMSLATGRIVGFEALVRWEHPERGQLLPGRFVPLAEETDMIALIGQWVLREACHQAREWQRQYHSDPPLVVCVNLSARQLHATNLYRVVDQILQESGLEPDSLDLEITESVAMEDAPATAAALKELDTLGVRMIIDNFGTGYSSLSHLERFPVDYIKIDRSFVGKLEEETGARVLVKAMIDLVHALGLAVIAEGVETAGQLEWLREMGCDMAQGHYLARPLPSKAAQVLLEKQHS